MESSLGRRHVIDLIEKVEARKVKISGKRMRALNKMFKRHNKVMAYIGDDQEAFFGFTKEVAAVGMRQALKSYKTAVQSFIPDESFKGLV